MVHFRDLLRKHIYTGQILTENLSGSHQYQMWNGESIQFSNSSKTGGEATVTPTVNSSYAGIETSILVAKNGDIVHIIYGIVRPSFFDKDVWELGQEMNLTSALR